VAEKTYRVGVIGHTGRGNYGHGLDTLWADVPRTQLVAVADEDKMGLAAATRRLKVKQAFTDYREMLDKVRPDIVAIAPRWPDGHCEMVQAAAEHGAHIYLEKPMCTTLAEADTMVEACERTHVKLAIAHQTRYSPILKVVQQMIDQGKIGRVIEFRGRGKEDRRGGGEDLWVLGTHVMDLIRALGGHPTWCQGHVSQDGEPVTKKHVAPGNEGIGPLAGDAVHAMYGMPEGAVAYFDSIRGVGANPTRFGLTVYGTAGVIDLHTGYLPSAHYLNDGTWTPGRTGTAWQVVTSAGVDKPEPLSDGGLHAGNVLAVNDLLSAIEEDRQPLGNMYEARGATEMIVAVFESHRQGGKVALPLENRENPLSQLS
jgi:predicted dehydrogenase